jgi:ribosomal protein S18 acetylase RimI-like enzyme
VSDARERVTIRPARREEAAALADVIRRAFVTEELVYGDIPPLHETAADLEASFDAGEVTLAAELDGVLVGTVRGETMADGSVMVRRLAVLVEARGYGIARQLMTALEDGYPEAARFELFTGELNAPALGLYDAVGYTRIGAGVVGAGITVVTLEKRS